MQLPPDIRRQLLQAGPGASLMLAQNGIAEVIFLLPIGRVAWKAAAIGSGHMELHTLDPEGRIARLVYQVFDQGQSGTPLTLDAFLNPSNPHDRAILASLASPSRTQLTIHAFSEPPALSYLGSKLVRWHAQHRSGAQQLLDLTVSTHTDWPAAKERYVREHPLE